MRDGYSLYDTHTHIGTARHSGRRFSADQMLARMDGFGVDRSLLIPFPVVEDYRAAHDEIARAVRGHPDRFAGACCIYPFIPEAEFRDEVRRCAEELGFRAIKLQPQYQALNPVSARSDFFFAAANEFHLPVVCHTGAGAPFALPSLFIMPARKFPDLPIVLGHAGGSSYFLEAIVAAAVCPNIYVELSSLMPHHIRDVIAHVPPARLMVGSDIPESLETEMGKIQTMDLPPEAKRDILWNTARRLFDREEA
ncbi:MAG: amidohydrolase family protein [Bryobacteraceae bacterium]